MREHESVFIGPFDKIVVHRYGAEKFLAIRNEEEYEKWFCINALSEVFRVPRAGIAPSCRLEISKEQWPDKSGRRIWLRKHCRYCAWEWDTCPILTIGKAGKALMMRPSKWLDLFFREEIKAKYLLLPIIYVKLHL